jgi:hypothetical protein
MCFHHRRKKKNQPVSHLANFELDTTDRREPDNDDERDRDDVDADVLSPTCNTLSPTAAPNGAYKMLVNSANTFDCTQSYKYSNLEMLKNQQQQLSITCKYGK